jgi:hypothetical protein
MATIRQMLANSSSRTQLNVVRALLESAWVTRTQVAASHEACDQPCEEEGKEDTRHAILMGRCLCRSAWLTAF